MESRKLGVTILVLLLLSIEIEGIFAYNIHLTKNELTSVTETSNIIELGNIVINKTNLNFLYPTIEILNNQTFNIPATLVGNRIFFINSKLRINVDTHLLNADSYGKTLQTFILVTRPDYLFPFSLIGKLINYNKTFILPENGTIEIPFELESAENNDRFCITIIAFTSVIGMYRAFHKLVISKSIFFECNYNADDMTAPFTICYLEGDEENE